jgi:CRP/FNR family transcriptional regulator
MNPGYNRFTLKNTGPQSHVQKAYCAGCPVLTTGFFAALNGPTKSLLNCLMEYGRYNPKQILFQEGNPSTRIYAIKTGYIKTFRTHPLGKDQVIQLAKPGDVINLEGIQGGKCTVTAEVLTDAEICFLEIGRLTDMAARDNKLSTEVMRLMAHSIEQSQHRILDFGTRTAKARLARFLLDLIPHSDVQYPKERSMKAGKKTSKISVINLPLTRQEIADLIGVRLETISRLFLLLKNKGILSTDRRTVRVLDANRLLALAR